MAGKVNIKWNQRALDAVVKEAGQNYLPILQKRLDSLVRLHTGKPVEEIKPFLQADFRKNGGSITEPELTEWAQMISDGTRIVARL